MTRPSRALGALALPAVLAAGLMLAPASASPADADSASGAQTDGILITLNANASNDLSALSGARALDDNGISLLAEAPVVQDLAEAGLDVDSSFTAQDGTVTLAADAADGMSDAEALEQARGVEGVAAAQYNYVYHLIDFLDEEPADNATAQDGISLQATSAVNDPIAQVSNAKSHPNQYWAYATDLVDAWEDIANNSGDAASTEQVTIAVMDSGVQLDHEDLKDSVLTDLAYDATENKPLADCEVQDCAGHGTAVAGIAAATSNNGTGIAGASNGAKILPIKVVENDGSITTEDLIKGYNQLFSYIKSGACDSVRVVNMSIGGYANSSDIEDEAFHNAIKTALNSYGILTVCSGGNSSGKGNPNPGETRTDPMYPSDWEECVSVTSLDADGTNTVLSDYNMAKDISAPGESIYSTALSSSSTSSYSAVSGTSAAAPQVSGTVALLYANAPEAEPTDILDALYQTATPVNDPEHDRTQVSGSHGALNADDALAYLEEHTAELEPDPEPVPVEPPFTDVEIDAWYYDAVAYAYSNGYMHGLSGTTRFAPNECIVRQDAAVVLYNILGNGEKAASCGLPDVEQSYYTDAVNWVVEHGYMNGYWDEAAGAYTRFGVGEPITREQLACIVANIARKQGDSASAQVFYSMPDHGSTSSWAVDGVIWATDRGIINGVKLSDGRYLAPQAGTTRAEMAAIMMNCLEGGVF